MYLRKLENTPYASEINISTIWNRGEYKNFLIHYEITTIAVIPPVIAYISMRYRHDEQYTGGFKTVYFPPTYMTFINNVAGGYKAFQFLLSKYPIPRYITFLRINFNGATISLVNGQLILS